MLTLATATRLCLYNITFAFYIVLAKTRDHKKSLIVKTAIVMATAWGVIFVPCSRSKNEFLWVLNFLDTSRTLMDSKGRKFTLFPILPCRKQEGLWKKFKHTENVILACTVDHVDRSDVAAGINKWGICQCFVEVLASIKTTTSYAVQ